MEETLFILPYFLFLKYFCFTEKFKQTLYYIIYILHLCTLQGLYLILLLKAEQSIKKDRKWEQQTTN